MTGTQRNRMTDEPPKLKSLEQFLFQAPLYAPFSLLGEFDIFKFYGENEDHARMDGHCPYCQRTSIFTVASIQRPGANFWTDAVSMTVRGQMHITCGRNNYHRILYYFIVDKLVVQKIGQHPSLADISNDEASAYRAILGKPDAAEFHKAIGLAAHGVGVGSFVYLRRVFERLIQRRFEEFKSTKGWQDEQFYAVRMEDKIKLLKDHLPEFLVQNRSIYSILSKGLHELDEKTCLGWFEVMKQSIIIILKDDKKKKEELESRALFSDTISGFSTQTELDG